MSAWESTRTHSLRKPASCSIIALRNSSESPILSSSATMYSFWIDWSLPKEPHGGRLRQRPLPFTHSRGHYPTAQATNSAKATQATKNSALLLAKGFVALKNSFVAIFSPPLFSTKATKRPPPLLAVAGCTIGSTHPRVPNTWDEFLSLICSYKQLT